MGGFGMLLLLVLLISATSSSVLAGYTRYSIQFYETTGGDPNIFKPDVATPVRNKGYGFVKHNTVVDIYSGREVGTVGGLYFFHGMTTLEDVVTITFNESLGGIWKGSSLNLRGLWLMNANGTGDANAQELSIVGGQGPLRFAFGSVYYKKVATKPRTKWIVTCDIFVDWSLRSIPKTYVNLDSQSSLSTAVQGVYTGIYPDTF